MNEVQQEFLRFFLSRQTCSKDEAANVLKELSEYLEEPLENLQFSLDALNTALKCYDLEIMVGKSELTGSEAIALVQICESSIAECSKFDDKKTKLFFSKLLSKITQSSGGYLTEIECINLSSEVELKQSVAETAVKEFVASRWLEEQQGKIYLGVRALLEIGPLLATTYPNAVKICSLCKNNVFYGAVCSNCSCKSHNHCLSKFQERSKTCPSCKADWSNQPSSMDSSQDNDSVPSSASKRPRLISDDSD